MLRRGGRAVSIPPSIKAELDQTPEWWQGEFDALVRKQIPRDYAYHADHYVEYVDVRTYADRYALQYIFCNDCGVSVER